MTLFGLTALVAAGAFFAVSFWDSLVEPGISLVGAVVFSVRYPLTLGGAFLLALALLNRFRRYR